MKFAFALALLFIIGNLLSGAAAACICTANYDPVCATNGRTYSNECNMRCAGASLRRRGRC